MRSFDTKQQSAEIQRASKEAAREIFPVKGRLRTVILKDVWVEDNKSSDDFAAQAKIKSKDGTYGVPLYASLDLIDNATNKVIDSSQKLRLFLLPKITDRFSYIVKGNEYQVHNQLRLKPGVYTLRKQNGELKTQVNLAKGKNFDIVFNEKNNKFFISKVGGGQANIPLYPALIFLGISHAAIEKAWGEGLANANKATEPKIEDRLKNAFGVKNGNFKDYLNQTEISKDTTQSVLGSAFDKVDGQLLLASSKDLLKTRMGKKEPTDRDSLEYKELYSVEDYLKERLEKNKKTLAFKIRRNIDSPKKNKLSQIVNPAAFSSVIESFFTQDDKSSTPEQTNPLEMLTGQFKTTIMGSGGIKQEHAITDNMREVHSSHFGFMDPIHTPESSRIGANLHLPLGALKDGKEMKTILAGKDGKPVALTPKEVFNKKVILPGQKGDKVKAMYQGKTVIIDKKDGDYTSPNPKALFSWSTNMVPFLASNQGNRAMMASKMLEQAISLKHREAPLVQVSTDGKKSIESDIGRRVAATAPDDGVVTKINKDYIEIKTKDGVQKVNLYNNFTLNRKSFLNHEATVKVGDRVKKGQVLADSNYTKDGTLALGVNAKVAYLPYKGLNFEDGIVITESAAEKLTSEHIHKKHLDIDENTVLKLAAYKAIYPNTLTSQNLNKLDNDGVMKVGETVKQGEALIASLRKRVVSKNVALVKKQLADRPKDNCVYWPYEDDGKIMDIKKTRGKVTIFVKTEEKAKIGDKLSGRMGNKGIITKIIPDSVAPKTKDGEAAEILLNPAGVISRINIGQIYESAAGKAALKKGKPHLVENFSGENYRDSTNKLLKDSGVEDKEELFDGETGKSLGKVHMGNPYVLKLFKQSTSNFSARQGGPGQAYDLNMQPVKSGGEEGSKSLDLLSMYAMLSHGARANLREMSTLKSNQNDEYWKALKSGQQLPPPKSPFVYEKFMEYLKASGIDTKKEGSKITLAPLTDKQIDEMSKMEIKDPRFYRAKDQEPIKGGFLDQRKLGGFQGGNWGHIELKEPVINPVFETAVRKLTGLGKKFDEIMAGKMHIDDKGNLNTSGKGVTGGRAVEKILKKIDVDRDLKKLTDKASKASGSTLDGLNKQIRYLKNLKDLDLRPEEAYIRKKVPIIPPKYRPIYPMPDGSMMNADSNVLYSNVGVLNKMMELPVMDLLPEEEKSTIRKEMYDHVKGVSGLTDLNIKGRVRDGFISEIKGGHKGQPKEGFFLSKVISKKQDFVGRGTIIPEPDLGVDEAAIPEKMAWKLFEPFVIRELKNHGKTPLQAIEEIKKKTTLARKALDVVMRDRKILLNRAPSLHKFSVMAFKPKVTQGKAIKIPPLVVSGFNADFNGDSVDITTVFNVRYNNSSLTAKPEYVYTSMEAGQLFEQVVGISISEMINDANGYTAIYEIQKGKLQTMSIVDNKPIWTDIQRLTVHTSHGPCFLVRTHTGTEVKATEHHNFSYVDENLNLNCIKTEVMPTKILIPKVKPIIGGDKILTLNVGKHKIRVDEEISWLFGFFAGDGSVSEGVVSFCDTDPQIIERIEDIARRRFNYSSKKQGTSKHKDSIFRIYSTHMASWFKKFCGAGFDKKVIPDFIYNSPESIRLAYIEGILEAEGSVGADSYGNYQVRIEMCNRPIIENLRMLMASCGINGYLKECLHEGKSTGWMVRVAKKDFEKLSFTSDRKAGLLKQANEVKSSRIKKDKFDLVPFSEKLYELMKEIGKKAKNLNKDQKAFKKKWAETNPGRKVSVTDFFKNREKEDLYFVSRHIAMDLVSTYGWHDDPLLNKWISIVKNTDLMWESVEEVREVDRDDVMFDLTVPEGEMFSIQNGLITHNTMTVHVPISDEANNEADKMLPSNNLYKPGSGKLMINPSQEAQVGIFYLSKTPKGRETLNKILPSEFKVTSTLDKAKTKDLLMKLSKSIGNKEFAEVVGKLKSAGETEAFGRGFTLGMDDLAKFDKDRDKVVKAVSDLVAKAKTPQQLADVNKKAQSLIDGLITKKLKDTDNPLYDMVESGARGSMGQLRQILASPIMVTDAKQNIVPSVISKSYAEGLDIGDYWTSLYGARRGMMDRALQTSLPGAFSKDIMATTIDNVISKEDCGVKEGREFAISDGDLIGRFTAKDQGGIPRNTLIDSSVINKAKSSGMKKIEARTPLKCLVAKGTCSKCYGIDEKGGEPELGDNIGAKAGQTISEPLVQLVMNTFHTGGTAGTGSDATGYKRIEQLLHMPKIVTGAAPLSPTNGKVEKIEKGLAGGYDVWISGKKEHVPQGRKLKVRAGQMVRKGMPLSDGVIKPQDLVRLRGMEEAQTYVADELQKAYANQGVKLEKKVFETVVRSAGNTTQVLNNPKDSNFVPGDIIPYTVANNHNKNLTRVRKTDEAEGEILAKNYGPFRKGHAVVQKDIALLKALGHKEVEVTKDPIVHAPTLKGISTIPLLRKDWMAALGYRNLAKALTEGAGQGWSTDLEGYHPIPAFARGSEFGKGKDGKY